MAIATSIEALLARRTDLLREISEIDAELERATLALQGLLDGRRPPPIRHNFRRDLRVSGSIPNAIYTALALREPRSIKDLAAHLNVHENTLNRECKRMIQAGYLSRVCLQNRGRSYVYARTTEALNITTARVAQPETQEVADAAG